MLANSVGLHSLAPENFIGLRQEEIDCRGWWTFPNLEAVARHVPVNMTLDVFLDRCLCLNKLIAEGLVQRSLRQTLTAIGAEEKETKDLGTLKLFDLIVRLCQVAGDAGLNFSTASAEITSRLEQHGTDPAQPIPRIFALYDMRILKAHTSDGESRLSDCLRRFGSSLNAAAGGYGLILDRMYDALIAELAEVNRKIEAALRGVNARSPEFAA